MSCSPRKGRREFLSRVVEANSPSRMRQDYFTSHPGFTDCSSRLIRAGMEPRVPQGFVALNLIGGLEVKLWSSNGMITVFDYVQKMAELCRSTKACTSGRLANTNTAYFWEEYRNISGPRQFRSDLRGIWRFLFQNNDLFMSIFPKLVTLATRDLLTPAMQAESIPAFTFLYSEMLSEVVSSRCIARRARLVYRRVLNAYRTSDFYSAPQCRCCNRRICTEDVLGYLCGEENDASKPTATDSTAGIIPPDDGSSPVDVKFGKDRVTVNQTMQDLLPSSLDSLPRGLSVRPEKLLREFQRWVDTHTLKVLDNLLSDYDYREVLMNDFLVTDLRLLGQNLGVRFEHLYATDCYQRVVDAFTAAIKTSGTRLVRSICMSVLFELVYCIHLRRVGSNPEHDWAYGSSSEDLDEELDGNPAVHPSTLAQQFWLSLWRIIENHIQRKEKGTEIEENLTPSFLLAPVGVVSPTVANWLRFNFEICAINKMYSTHSDARIEAALSQICFELFELDKDSWPKRVRSDYDELVKRLGLDPGNNSDKPDNQLPNHTFTSMFNNTKDSTGEVQPIWQLAGRLKG